MRQFWIFFCLNQILIWPWSIFEKISNLLFRFLTKFRCSNVSAVTEHTQNQYFVVRYVKFFKYVHFGPIRSVPWRFCKIPIIYSWKLLFNLFFWVLFDFVFVLTLFETVFLSNIDPSQSQSQSLIAVRWLLWMLRHWVTNKKSVTLITGFSLQLHIDFIHREHTEWQ